MFMNTNNIVMWLKGKAKAPWGNGGRDGSGRAPKQEVCLLLYLREKEQRQELAKNLITT